MGCIAEALIRGGAKILQYRNKGSDTGLFLRDAELLRAVTEAHGVPFIVNDRVDAALAVCADGVHVGRHDMPASDARALVGKDRWVGLSVGSCSELEFSGSADYIGVGAIFPTGTKPHAEIHGLDLVRSVRACTRLPLIGIGGITLDNVTSVIEAGCDGVAVISAVIGGDDIENTVKRFIEKIQETKATTPSLYRMPKAGRC